MVWAVSAALLTSVPTSSTALVAASMASNLAVSVAIRDCGMERLLRSIRTLTPTCLYISTIVSMAQDRTCEGEVVRSESAE